MIDSDGLERPQHSVSVVASFWFKIETIRGLFYDRIDSGISMGDLQTRACRRHCDNLRRISPLLFCHQF